MNDALSVGLTVIITVSEDDAQGELEIVHLKLLAPTPKAVNPEVAEAGVVMVPVPEINVHKPVPTTGILPARVAVVEQMVWSGPANAVVGKALIVITFVAVSAGQPPDAAMILVTVYVPAILPTRFTSPVAVLTNTNPAVELNVPALDPGGNVGKGLIAFWQ